MCDYKMSLPFKWFNGCRVLKQSILSTAQNVHANGNCWASAGVIYLRGCLWQCCDNSKSKKANSFSLQFCCFNFLKCFSNQISTTAARLRSEATWLDCLWLHIYLYGRAGFFFQSFCCWLLLLGFCVVACCGIFHFVQYWAVRIFTLFVNILLCWTCLLYKLDSRLSASRCFLMQCFDYVLRQCCQSFFVAFGHGALSLQTRLMPAYRTEQHFALPELVKFFIQ